MEILIGSLRELAEHFSHFVRKRTRHHDAILRAFEFSGRDHFHGLGDLLRVLYRLNAPANVEKVRHRLIRYAVGAAAVVADLAGAVAKSVGAAGPFCHSILKSSSSCLS